MSNNGWRDVDDEDGTPFAGEEHVDAIVYVDDETSPELAGAERVRQAAAQPRQAGPAPVRYVQQAQGEWQPPAPPPPRLRRGSGRSRRLRAVLLATVPLLILGAIIYFFVGVYSGKYLTDGTVPTVVRPTETSAPAVPAP